MNAWVKVSLVLDTQAFLLPLYMASFLLVANHVLPDVGPPEWFLEHSDADRVGSGLFSSLLEG